MPDSHARKFDMGLRTFTTVGELLWYYVLHSLGDPPNGLKLLLLWLCSFYHFSFVFERGFFFFLFLFLVGWQHLPVYGCSIVAMLVPSQEEMSTCPSIQPSWTNLSQVLFYNVIFPHVFLSLIFLFFLDFTFFLKVLAYALWSGSFMVISTFFFVMPWIDNQVIQIGQISFPVGILKILEIRLSGLHGQISLLVFNSKFAFLYKP